MWVVQEVRLARDGLKLIHGPFVFDIDFLRLLSILANQSVESNAEELQVSSACLNLIAHSKGPGCENLSSLTALVSQYGNQICEDTRDLVYGMLGLVSPLMSAASIESITTSVGLNYF